MLMSTSKNSEMTSLARMKEVGDLFNRLSIFLPTVNWKLEIQLINKEVSALRGL